MKEDSVARTSEERTPAPNPSEGGEPARQTNAELGAISKGSATPGHTAQANQTTSSSPRTRVSRAFLEKLGEMYDGEKRLTHALPLLQLAAKSEDLKTLLGVHLEETRGHVKSLEDLAHSLAEELPDKTCQPIADLVRKARSS